MPTGGSADKGDLDSAIQACAGDNACEAAWQRAYAYAADQAYQLAVFQALQGIAFGVMQYASADRTADKQFEIADRQMIIAEEEYDRYKAIFVDCENALAAEICAVEIPDVDYDTRADRALRDVRREFSAKRRSLERARQRYCMADQLRSHCELDKAEAMAVVVARDIAYRYAESYQDLLDERRWTRRMAIVDLGRSVMTGQSTMYQTGMSPAINALGAKQGALDNLLGTISGGIGGVLNARSAVRMANYNTNPAPTPGQLGGESFIHSSVPTPAGMTVGSGANASGVGM